MRRMTRRQRGLPAGANFWAKALVPLMRKTQQGQEDEDHGKSEDHEDEATLELMNQPLLFGICAKNTIRTPTRNSYRESS